MIKEIIIKNNKIINSGINSRTNDIDIHSDVVINGKNYKIVSAKNLWKNKDSRNEKVVDVLLELKMEKKKEVR